MSDGMYIAMNGAAARERQLESIADNLANASTPGFKAEKAAFHSFLAASKDGTEPSKEQIHPMAVATALDMRPGLSVATGRALDVVPQGKSFLAVERENGEIGYTRAGSLQIDPQRRLASGGRPVMGLSGGPILVPQGVDPIIAEDGTVKAGATVLGRLALYELNGGIDRVASGVVAPGTGGAAVPVESKFETGAVEQSNVNAIETAVEMISAQRNYETSMQALTTYRSMDQKAIELGRTR